MKLYEKLLLASAGTAGASVVAWRTMFPWIGYDIQLIKTGHRMMKKREEAMKSFLVDKFEQHAINTPKKPFIIFEDSVYTYEYVDQMANKVANLAKTWGLKALDVVAIMIQNEPAFVWTFLGLQKLGVTVAFINFNLKMQPLAHSILAAKPLVLIVGDGEALLEAVTEIRDDLGSMPVYVQGLGSRAPPYDIISYDPLFHAAHASAISSKVRSEVTMEDICCFIYTSGTTGVPKPALIRYFKMVFAGIIFEAVNFYSSDIVYSAMPLYHSSGTLGVLCVLNEGATLVLKRKFSASQFWEDCYRHDVTVIQYIGELFRYLLAQPPSKYDSQHKIKAAFGNGLRKDIWHDVEKRFKIPQIVEFFGATEGPTLLLNVSNRPGAIGRLSPFMNRIDPDPKALVKFDLASAMPIRDKNGHCIKVGIGEPGLFISKVPDDLIKDGKFNVYQSSNEANEKKLVRNAFHPGDIYFNFGDVFMLDEDYFLYFKDRIGDTFRWKGENVSTTELANVITRLSFINDANVYGITVPGHDGRAGMVALTLNDGHRLGDKELKELYDHVVEKLPSYAQPLFIRLLDQAIITGTFKQRKVELVEEGYDLNKVKDSLYFIDREKHTYAPLSPSDLSKFITSKL